SGSVTEFDGVVLRGRDCDDGGLMLEASRVVPPTGSGRICVVSGTGTTAERDLSRAFFSGMSGCGQGF
ncbi:MAG: hypothetical protein OXF79_08995, partial [Chloroflexi bacterium]|nr:hypothetical protein [Chloroflexota bacterium]